MQYLKYYWKLTKSTLTFCYKVCAHVRDSIHIMNEQSAVLSIPNAPETPLVKHTTHFEIIFPYHLNLNLILFYVPQSILPK